MESSLCSLAATLLCLLAPIQCAAQVADFKVAWTTIGVALSAAAAGDAKMQPGAKVARVDVQPEILQLVSGKQVCIGELRVQAFGADGRQIAFVPLEMSVRQDQKPQLQITHTKGICMRPARKGEYPIRFTSKVPAADDTLRGAQIFLRVM
ncbi:MAG TPA: hypothetical protein VH814_16640 [Steroidobacteraceae bacterium]|jgi:hypothetical protein